jgi:single-stranded-DNA-specific exonuclease
VNAFIRLATYEERQLLIKAFCEIDDETFLYTKRGETFPIEENIYEHVVRLMQSYKGKQDRMRKKAQPILTAKGNKADKVAIIDATGIIDTGLTGVVAIRVAEDLNVPALLLQKRDDEF